MAPLPLSKRPLDKVIIAILVLFTLTTLLPDFAALTVDFNKPIDPENAPFWPPAAMVEAVQEYGKWCDELFLAEPPFFKAMMIADVAFLAPFYLLAIYAFWAGKSWIRNWCMIYGSHVVSYAFPLIWEQCWGPHKSPRPEIVLAFYSPYWIFGLFLMWRVWGPKPFGNTEELVEKKKKKKKSTKSE